MSDLSLCTENTVETALCQAPLLEPRESVAETASSTAQAGPGTIRPKTVRARSPFLGTAPAARSLAPGFVQRPIRYVFSALSRAGTPPSTWVMTSESPHPAPPAPFVYPDFTQESVDHLHYVEGLRVRETAALIGVPVGAVKAQLHRRAAACGRRSPMVRHCRRPPSRCFRISTFARWGSWSRAVALQNRSLRRVLLAGRDVDCRAWRPGRTACYDAVVKVTSLTRLARRPSCASGCGRAGDG